MGTVLLQWGPHVFTVGSMSYEELRQTAQGRWEKHPIIGRRPAGQYVGPGEEPLTVRGTVYPLSMGGSEDAQVQAVLADCSSGRVYSLVTANGDIMGSYRLERCEAVGTYPRPQRQQPENPIRLHLLPA